MCGRTSLFLPQAVVESRFDATYEGSLPSRYNIAPFDDLAVITGDAPDTIDLLEWGFLPSWADTPERTHRPINARSETARESPMFRDAFEERHCLVLVDGFYEWQDRERGGSQPYRIEKPDEEPFALAGLWEHWEDGGEDDADVQALDTVTILTTDANDLLEPIHDRMPVVLPPDREREWLAGNGGTAEDLLDPYTGGDLEAFPVSRAVNDPANDSQAVIEPVEPDQEETQAGLDDFA
ncbi:MAG: SOS response-associated peptidase [Halodesulfurarchaeum sp.]